MRIQHTENEVYSVYYRCGDDKWHFYHSYSSVSGYRSAIKKLKGKYDCMICKGTREYSPLEIRVEWSPFPFCDDWDKCTILQEDYNG